MITQAEFKKLVLSDKMIKMLEESSSGDLQKFFGVEFSKMKDFDQNNPHHCYDLLHHTIYTVLSISPTDLSNEEFFYIRTAALFHDIGKPEVAMTKENKTVFYGHAKRSAEIAYRILLDIGYEESLCRYLCFFIEHHDAFILFKLPSEIYNSSNSYIKVINNSNITEAIKDIQKSSEKEQKYIPSIKDFDILMNLCIADVKAQSEIVIQNQKEIDSRVNKVQRLNEIWKVIKKKNV